MNKKKIIKIICICSTFLLLLILFIFFYANKSKKMKFGNNSSNQEIIENILNISSYETMIEVEVNSNKNTNKYVIKQTYIKGKTSEQEILEPENIQGIKIIKNENELKLENSKLNLTKIYNDYAYITDNCMDLNTFIELYQQNEKQEYEEKNGEIILDIENTDNPYTKYRTLYISKETGNPTKMEIKDNSKKTSIYILYREVKFQ